MEGTVSTFYIKVGDEVITCEFLYDVSPQTCGAIEELLPLEGELHCAKIAGDEVFFPIPLKLPVEKSGAHAHDLTPGTIAYWPDRPHLCIFHDAPQEEDASVTLVGNITENLEALGKIAAQVRKRQGMKVVVDKSPE